jgi:hypothetical protein
LLDKYNKICKENPEFSDQVVEFEELDDVIIKRLDATYTDVLKITKKGLEQAKYYSKNKDEYKAREDAIKLEQEYEKLKSEMSVAEAKLIKSKKKIKRIKIGAAITLLGTAAAGIITNMKKRNDLLLTLETIEGIHEGTSGTAGTNHMYLNQEIIHDITSGIKKVVHYEANFLTKIYNKITDLDLGDPDRSTAQYQMALAFNRNNDL